VAYNINLVMAFNTCHSFKLNICFHGTKKEVPVEGQNKMQENLNEMDHRVDEIEKFKASSSDFKDEKTSTDARIKEIWTQIRESETAIAKDIYWLKGRNNDRTT